jgi:hypothetical protein
MDEIPVVTESQWNTQFGGIPTITESQWNSTIGQGGGINSATETFAGGFTNLLQGVTLGFGDEIVGGVNAGIDTLLNSAFGGETDITKNYASRVAQARDMSDRYARFAPGSALANQFAGVALPIPGAISKGLTSGKGLAAGVRKVAVGTGTGAVLGGITGAGVATEGNRLEGAMEGAGSGALFGGGLTAGAQAVGRGLGSIGRSLRNRSMGITARDAKAAADSMDLGTRGQGWERLNSAVDQVEAATRKPRFGTVKWYTNLGRSTDDFILRTATTADDVAATSGNRIGQIIGDADAAISHAPINTNEAVLDQGLNRMSGLSREQVAADVVARENAFMRKPEVVSEGSTLPNWHKENVALNIQKDAADGVETAGQALWRRSIRSQIENYVEALRQQALIQARPGEFEAVKAEYGALQELVKGLAKDLPAAQAADLTQQLQRLTFTTSGGGLAGVKIAAEASPTLGAAALINNLISYFPQAGRIAGQLGMDVGRVATRLGSSGVPGAVIASTLGNSELANPDYIAGPDTSLEDQRMNRFQALAIPSAIAGAIAASPTGQPVPMPIQGLRQVPASVALVSQISPLLESTFGNVMKHAPSIIDRIVHQESRGNSRARSPKGAMGLMQLMPATFREVAAKMGLPANADPYDPETNRAAGEFYYNELLQKYGGSVPHALAAYNWGMGNVDNLIRRMGTDDINVIKHRMPKETKNYLAKILNQSGDA